MVDRTEGRAGALPGPAAAGRVASDGQPNRLRGLVSAVARQTAPVVARRISQKEQGHDIVNGAQRIIGVLFPVVTTVLLLFSVALTWAAETPKGPCANLRVQTVPTRRQYEALNTIRIVLLERGQRLRERIVREQQVISGTNVSALGAFSEVLSSTTRQQLEARATTLEKEFAAYDKDVSSCLVVLSTLRTELFTQLAHVVYASQIAAQRDLLQSLLRDLHEQVARYSSQTRSLVTTTLSLLVGAISAFASVTALVLVLRQIALMRRQDRLMREQTEIADRQLDISRRQDEFNRMLLARRAALELLINRGKSRVTVRVSETGATLTFNLEFSVENSGNKTARGFYNTVYIPSTLMNASASSYLGNLSRAGELEIGGAKYSVYQNFKEEPVFPSRSLKIGSLALRGPRGDYTMLWQIVAEDGVFPGEAHVGEFAVRVLPEGERQEA